MNRTLLYSLSRLGLSIAALAFLTTTLPAATYYVAPDGSDTNPGTNIAQPFATPQKAVTLSALAPGDTIYIRGGNYVFDTQVKPGKAGAAGNPIKLWAYPGERPVFDFATMPESSNKALDVRRDYWHVKGIEVKNAPDSGIFVGGQGNLIEGCIIHDCDNDGVILGSSTIRATNSLILNCDSYRNYQHSGDGNNGDGFAAKVGNGPGNVFRGCRAWNNSDDGWDFYDNNIPVLLENCWAFSNGYDLWGYGAGWSGNGNGFKLGGEGTTAEHNLTNCVAFGNRSKGFDHNNGNAGQTMVNCTSYGNGGANFSFFETPSAGPRGYNLLINCASLGGGALHNLAANTVQVSNSWQLVTAAAADFASLDTSVATNARNADYSLPITALFRLAPGSQLIDRGANVGLPYNGVRPDLGAFEFGDVVPPQTPSTFDSAGCGLTNGGYRLKLNGLSSHGPVVLFCSTNLTSWTPLATNPATTGSTTFLDTDYGVRPHTFYRAQEL